MRNREEQEVRAEDPNYRERFGGVSASSSTRKAETAARHGRCDRAPERREVAFLRHLPLRISHTCRLDVFHNKGHRLRYVVEA